MFRKYFFEKFLHALILTFFAYKFIKFCNQASTGQAFNIDTEGLELLRRIARNPGFLETLRNCSQAEINSSLTHSMGTTHSNVRTNDLDTQRANARSFLGNGDSELVSPLPKYFPTTLISPKEYEEQNALSELKAYLDCAPEFPELVIQADVDSIYGYSKSMSDLKSQLGVHCKFEFRSVTGAYTNDVGSRFSVNVDQMDDPPYVRNNAAKTVPLNWYPNMNIGVCLLTSLSKRVFLQIYNLNVSGFTKVAHFSTNEIAVVNAALNSARRVCAACQEYSMAIRHEFAAMDRFETKVGDREWQSISLSRDNYLSSGAMDNFCRVVDKAFLFMSNPDSYATASRNADRTGHYEDKILKKQKFWLPSHHGIFFKNDDVRRYNLSKETIIEIASQLYKGILFTFSAAGIKSAFDGDPAFRLSLPQPRQQEIDQQRTLFREKRAAFFADKQKEAYEENPLDWPDGPDSIEPSDIGLHDGIDSIDIAVAGKGLFEDYVLRLQTAVNVCKDDLVRKVHTKLKNIFVHPQRKNMDFVYYDIGIRVMINGNYSCLTYTPSTEKLLEEALSER